MLKICAKQIKAYTLLIYHKYLKDTPLILWTLILLNFNSLTFCNSQIEAMDALNNIYMDLINFFLGGGGAHSRCVGYINIICMYRLIN